MKNSTMLFTTLGVAIIALGLSLFNVLVKEKLAFIESNTLLEQYSGAIEVRTKLQAERQKWQENIKALEAEVTKLNTAFISEGSKWNAKTVKTKKAELEQKQKEYYRYSTAIQDKALKMENEMMAPVFVELNELIKEYATKNGYQIVWGTVNGGNILYGSDAANITQPFLDYLTAKEQ
jgi:outer membrane protein